MPTTKTAPATPAAKKKLPPAAPAKPVAKTTAEAPAKKPQKAEKTAAQATATVAAKPKQRLVRDSFTIPKAEYTVLDELKRRAAKLEQPAKKSELLRAGIKALSALPDEALLVALKAVPTLKTGRPKHK